MTLEQVTSFSEISAAIATIVTLAYLGFQIRNNNKLQKAESRRAGMTMSAQLSTVIGQSRETAELFHRGIIEYANLSAAEKVQFSFLFSVLAASTDIVFNDWHLGPIEKGSFENQSKMYFDLRVTPGGRQYWKSYGKGHNDAFREYIVKHVFSGIDPVGSDRATSS